MQTMPSQNLDPQLRRVEADMFSRMDFIFRCCHHLAGFTLQDSAEPDEVHPSDDAPSFVSDIQFSRRVTEDEDKEARYFINNTVADLIAERDEALNLLRDRTFARALH